MNPGSIVGITFGVLIAFLVASLVLLYVTTKRSKKRLNETNRLNFDNPNYSSGPIGDTLELKTVKKEDTLENIQTA